MRNSLPLPQLEACGQWDGLSRRFAPEDDARGYYVRGRHSRHLFAAAARKQWLDDAPDPQDVQRGYLRHVPFRHQEQHPQLGLLVYRGTKLVPASRPGRGAFAATWWVGNDPI